MTTPESSRQKLLHWLRLARVPNVGPVTVKRLIDAFKTPEAVLAADMARLGEIEGVGTIRARSFLVAPKLDQIERELDESLAAGVQVLCPDDPAWPPGLRNIPDPPIVLFLRGEILRQDALAIGIVGSRKCSFYGREQAERFGALLAGAGFCIVSGGARGIDTGAHFGALKTTGRTIVVQGCGMANNYPPENQPLYDRIVAEGRGAVLSELPLHTPPDASNFPGRNRIIAAMSLGILVIEANLRSGSLITARLAAADYGREVFALPGRVDSVTSAGTHHLIKTGSAHLVDSIDDILDNLGEVGTQLRTAAQPSVTASASAPAASLFPETPPATLTSPQQKILAAIQGDASIDDICDRSSLPPSTVMAELTLLQIRGLISRAGNNRFAKRAKTKVP